MAKHTYNIVVTLDRIIQLNADSEQEALDMVGDAVVEEGYSDLNLVSSRIEEVIENGPAIYEAWQKAWNHVYAVEAEYGKDSPEYAAALAAAKAMPSGF